MTKKKRVYTEEQRKAACERAKKYNKENKEKVAAQKAEWVKNNPDRVKAHAKKYYKAYYDKNKEGLNEEARKWAANNKDKVAARKKRFAESKKDGLYTVYYLKEDHYVGQTDNMYQRMKNHKGQERHVEDVEILAKFETREEAMAFEAKLHDMGYHGRNNGK
jgi:ABC-type nitrate/sulfonate/bicarbonate transport system substrate-binding protein